ncbi:hypothetical protein DAPPUDRAFT_334319 [Daphnia pulex]|uniref:CSC1/OSCA1-like cytosolic domain-containing protein n=1 Tax=Daphnia pulex TaxID=6669 RepID=E9HVA7_DAPPU|nr:hypothetical protein DAPPUDRAFT_334319 [Daphnia pulex]|eukprot:EFX64315.1 hypothetical protein DAPPUDRAFT_334319 [Daphnia pulex]
MYGPEWIQYRNDDKNNKEMYAATYYNRKEEILSTKMDTIIIRNNLEFTGTVFIRFDSQADAKAAKIAIRKYQTRLFWKRGIVLLEEEDQDFRPSQWNVRYAPPGSDIDWINLKKPRPAWNT